MLKAVATSSVVWGRRFSSSNKNRLLSYRSLATSRQRRGAAVASAAADASASSSQSQGEQAKEEEETAESSTSLPNYTTLSSPSSSLSSPLTILPPDNNASSSMSSLVLSSSSSSSSTATTSTDSTSTTTDIVYDPSLFLSSLHNNNNNPTLPTDWSDYEAATPLWNEIAALVSVTGRPLSTADYMHMALQHAEHGYYTTKQQKSDVDDFFDNDYEQEEEHTGSSTMIGPTGDFVTSPEISSVFGEALGIWAYTVWQQEQQQQEEEQQQASSMSGSWQIVEWGPGKGSLMADLLQLAYRVENFGNKCQYLHFIETSPVLRAVQKQTLQNHPQLADQVQLIFSDNDKNNDNDAKTHTSTDNDSRPTLRVHWHDSLPALQVWQQQQLQQEQQLFTVMICQEFFDALPVHSFEKTAQGYWRERMVDLAIREDMISEEEQEQGSNNMRQAEDGSIDATTAAAAAQRTISHDNKRPRLRMVLAPEVTPALQTLLNVDQEGNMINEDPKATTGSIVEVCPQGILLVQDMARLIQKQGGAALIIDYGQVGSTDSLRAFSKHQQVPFLARPGQVDVTADVDFGALRHAVNNSMSLKEEKESKSSVQAFGPVNQGDFLMSMGLQERIVAAIEDDATTDQQAEDLYQAMVRLASPEEMGVRYKALAITRQKKKDGASEPSPPPGFG